MYQPRLKARDRGGVIAAVAAIHAALLFVFLQLSGTVQLVPDQRVLEVFDITEVPPPEPEPPVVEQRREEKEERAPEEEGAASPENIRSEATPVVAPRPRVRLPVRPPVAVAETPNEGAAPTQGAGDRPGLGAGAGGTGAGTGAGGSGGGGGGGGAATRATILRDITSRDYPPQIRRSWPRGGAIFVRLRIEPNGRPSQCDVMRSYGDRAADQWTCALLIERGVFRPTTDASGRPVADWLGYVQRERGR